MVTDNADTESANDLGGADDMLSPMEATDSDDVLNDDGDEVVDPPEDWSGVDKFGMSAEEQRAGETLDQRLAEEEPDVVPEAVDSRDAADAAGADTVIEGSDVAEGASGVHHGQIDGAPEDGESLFPVVEDVTRRSDEP
ncbi:hypothetical protein ACWDUN_07795 [Mycobacterium sp. NPDC003323]